MLRISSYFYTFLFFSFFSYPLQHPTQFSQAYSDIISFLVLLFFFCPKGSGVCVGGAVMSSQVMLGYFLSGNTVQPLSVSPFLARLFKAYFYSFLSCLRLFHPSLSIFSLPPYLYSHLICYAYCFIITAFFPFPFHHSWYLSVIYVHHSVFSINLYLKFHSLLFPTLLLLLYLSIYIFFLFYIFFFPLYTSISRYSFIILLYPICNIFFLFPYCVTFHFLHSATFFYIYFMFFLVFIYIIYLNPSSQGSKVFHLPFPTHITNSKSVSRLVSIYHNSF